MFSLLEILERNDITEYEVVEILIRDGYLPPHIVEVLDYEQIETED